MALAINNNVYGMGLEQTVMDWSNIAILDTMGQWSFRTVAVLAGAILGNALAEKCEIEKKRAILLGIASATTGIILGHLLLTHPVHGANLYLAGFVFMSGIYVGKDPQQINKIKFIVPCILTGMLLGNFFDAGIRLSG